MLLLPPVDGRPKKMQSIVSAARSAAGKEQRKAPGAPGDDYKPIVNFDRGGGEDALERLQRRVARSEQQPDLPAASRSIRVGNDVVKPHKRDAKLPLVTTRLDDLPQALAFLHHIPEIPTSVVDSRWGKGLREVLPEGYVLSRVLGTGKYGTVLLAGNPTVGDYLVIKLVKIDGQKAVDDLDHELHMLKIFARAGLAPKPLVDEPVYYRQKGGGGGKKRYKKIGLIAMEAVHTDLQTLLKRRIKPSSLYEIFARILWLVMTMREHGLTHGDLHLGNIACIYDVNAEGTLHVDLRLIDFGWAYSDKKSFPDVDILQLLRTTAGNYRESVIDPHNKSLLSEWLYAFASTNIEEVEGVLSHTELDRLARAKHREYEEVLDTSVGARRAQREYEKKKRIKRSRRRQPTTSR